jgi:hypothetical protein
MRILKSSAVGLVVVVGITFFYLAVITIQVQRRTPADGSIGFDPVSLSHSLWLPWVLLFLVGFVWEWRRLK